MLSSESRGGINLDRGKAPAGTRIWSVLFQQVLRASTIGLVGREVLGMQGGNFDYRAMPGDGRECRVETFEELAQWSSGQRIRGKSDGLRADVTRMVVV